jgi:Holliday junction resolvase RusA-like endonuclease
MIGKKMFECPVETNIVFVLKGEDNIWPTSRLDGDADNLEKSVLDALNGIVFEDDKLVVRSIREKRCGIEPCVHIRIAPANP